MFLPIPWFSTEDFLKKKNSVNKSIHDLEDSFSDKINNIKILFPNLSIYYGMKTWCHLSILLVGVY